ncbi:GntR family transcriptional regulator [Kitasatospora sp. NPDC049285]|uniref:GntR family transcriptional regulator n=1 Tax=Kitasatospora sp. NPDC049285 TaxID=3157096 RepID=UPI00341B96B2
MTSPKRARVRDHLLELVDSLDQGDALPSERRLCAELDVSRPTLRAAVDELVRDGLLTRRQGQGVFVARPKIAQPLLPDADAPGVTPVEGTWASRTVDFTRIAAGTRIGRRLRLAPTSTVLRITRLRLVDGEPMCVEVLHVPESVAPGLTARDLELNSFYALLEQRYAVGVAEAVQTIEPTVTDEAEAELLDVPAYFPALLFERVTEDERGTVVEYTRSVYRGDRYKIVSQLSLARDRGRGRVLAGRLATAGPGPDARSADPFLG